MKSKTEIKKFLIRNSIIAYACVGIAIFSMILTFFTINKSIDESRKYLYVIRTDGEIVPMEWINRRENIAAEMKHHLTMFVENFYSLNQFNWERSVEKALWLGDVEQLHIRRINDGFYNRFMQFHVSHDAYLYPENIELKQAENGGVEFRIVVNVMETLDNQRFNYSLLCRGNIQIIKTGRVFPTNPHGLYITKYLEEQVIKDKDK